MTGFGRSEYEKDGRHYGIEIKSVNHKYQDISIRSPKFFNRFEDGMRKKIAECIVRGKIDVFVNFENYSNEGSSIHFNVGLAKEYIKELEELARETGIPYEISMMDIAKMPEIFNLKEEGDESIIANELMTALAEALQNFVTMRETEGQKLMEDLQKRIVLIEKYVSEIETYAGTLVEEYRQKLEIRVKELMKSQVVDENRLAQEIVIFSDKSSIEEELTRLKSHISQFHHFLAESSPIGKKFDFLIQEMNREVNTIGSKANCLEITKRVIELKTEIENIREQVQNIE